MAIAEFSDRSEELVARAWHPRASSMPASLVEDLTAARDVQAVGRALFVFLKRVMPADSILIALYDPATKQRTCVYSAGEDGEDDVSALPPLPLNTAPQSRAVKTGRLVIVGDLEDVFGSGPVVHVGEDRDPRVSLSSIAIPLKLRRRIIGVLELQSYRRHAFGPEHIDVLNVAAGMAALALDGVCSSWSSRRQAEARASRRQIDEVIATQAFSPVFQPVVDLATGAVAGYEALTRFADGARPDHRFQAAFECGLGPALEVATLRSSLEAARQLPVSAWISVNVSPHMVLTRQPLHDLLVASDRRVVVELTEHAAVGDYELFRRSMARLPSATEFAIDDAGAGYASFRHILELRPTFVKLDRQLILGIDRDPARQALVGALAEFGRASGSVLTAEGIETAEELQALVSLQIPLGQGNYVGRPAPAASWMQKRGYRPRATRRNPYFSATATLSA